MVVNKHNRDEIETDASFYELIAEGVRHVIHNNQDQCFNGLTLEETVNGALSLLDNETIPEGYTDEDLRLVARSVATGIYEQRQGIEQYRQQLAEQGVPYIRSEDRRIAEKARNLFNKSVQIPFPWYNATGDKTLSVSGFLEQSHRVFSVIQDITREEVRPLLDKPMSYIFLSILKEKFPINQFPEVQLIDRRYTVQLSFLHSLFNGYVARRDDNKYISHIFVRLTPSPSRVYSGEDIKLIKTTREELSRLRL